MVTEGAHKIHERLLITKSFPEPENGGMGSLKGIAFIDGFLQPGLSKIASEVVP